MIKIKKQYHNYRRSESECQEEIIFCCDNPGDSEHYGPIHRVFDPSQARLDDGTALELAKEFYNDPDDVEECVYPSNIVVTAGAWDDIDFINFLYEKNYFNNFDAIITWDGCVVFDYNLMTRD